MARITIRKRIGHTSKVSEQASFLIEDKAAKACKVLGLKEGIGNCISGAEAVAEMAIKILGLSRDWKIFYKMTDYFGHYEVAIAD